MRRVSLICLVALMLGITLGTYAVNRSNTESNEVQNYCVPPIATLVTLSESGYEPVAYPVFTADGPKQVMEYVDSRYAGVAYTGGVWELRSKNTKTRYYEVGEYDFDVFCFVFKRGSKVCFDPMEITER